MAEDKKTIKALASGRRDLFQIDPRIIKEKPGFNVRLDYGDMESLVNYVVEHGGVPSPLKVFMEDGEVYVDQGHRRLRAVMTAITERGADIKAIDCIGEPKHYSPDMRLIEMVASNEGLALNMLEQGIVFQRLINGGYEQGEVARKIGKSPSHVSGCVILASASKRIQNFIIEGKAKPTTVLGVLREVEGDEAQYNVLAKAIEDAEADGKNKATPGRARKAAEESGAPVGGNSGKPTISKQAKNLAEWADEHSVVYSERPKFKMVFHVLGYLKGDLTLDQLAALTD